MEYEELELKYEKLNKEFELFRNIVKPNDDAKLKVDLSKIEKIINEFIPHTLKRNAPPNFSELYFNFKYEYSKFREFILYERLIGKNIVALGGGFSSGKSSFLNSLIKKAVLPSEIDPSTAIPTYIVNDDDISVYGVNAFDSKIEMQLKDIKLISHGFAETTDENDEICGKELTLGHIIKSIFLSTPLQVYKHIAFLDTPGYSKPDTDTYSAKTDEKIARAQLNSSNYILWFVKVEDGTITEEDINFINTLKKEIPKLIIVNKADKRPEDDVKNIVNKIKSVLDVKGIEYVDVLAYSGRRSDSFDSVKIKEHIKKFDEAIYESSFAYNFKILFVKCKEYYENAIDNEHRRLNRLNTSITLADNDTVIESLTSLANEIKRNIADLKDISLKLKKLQDEFFTEIKYIADVVGIQMPEPSEIDLIKHKVKSPLEAIKKFKRKQGINNNDDLTMILGDAYNNINPVIDKAIGNSKYKEEIYNAINENFVVGRNEIKFGK